MAVGSYGSAIIITMEAATDLSALQYTAVTAAAGKATASTAASDKAIGVLQNKPVAGENAKVMVLGVSKWTAGAALATQGTALTSGTGGKALAVATAAGYALGISLTTAAADGGIIRALINATGYDSD